jgi:DNA-binding transcriptional LysR family regulator
MDIQQIRYFSRVYETRNFTRAASQLYITRQALRKSVRKLEEEVGQPLFVNEKNQLVPTEAARRLYEASRDALRGFDNLEHEVSRIKLEDAGVISFGQSRGSNAVFTGEEMAEITRPGAVQSELLGMTRVVEGSCAEMRDQVLSGEIAYAGIVATSVDESLFDYRVAREGAIYLAVNENDPLAAKDAIDIADLRNKRFVTQGPGYDVHDLIASRAHDRGFGLMLGDVHADFFDCMQTVNAGLGVTYAYREQRHPKSASCVVCKPFSDMSLRWKYCSIAKKGMGDPRLLDFFSGKYMNNRDGLAAMRQVIASQRRE